ncbi:MAG: indole-3-glycerol phosphate synthase TrpC [Actinomycetota bacterium]
MSDFLTEMSRASVLRARATRERADVADLQTQAASATSPLPLRLTPGGFDLFAEAKLASPSEGRLVSERSGHTVVSLARSYVSNGAAVVSVLTEPDRFAGSLEDLEEVAHEVDVPVMRKDFLVDPIQVVEARATGASGVLLIARMLPGDTLEEMTDLAISHGMFVLVEVFDRPDLEKAAAVFDRDVLVGVNCRDLATLGIDRSRFETLAPHLPDHLPAVAESGMTAPEHVASVAGLGYRMALVGSTLVSDPDPGARLSRFLSAGREALSGVSS